MSAVFETTSRLTLQIFRDYKIKFIWNIEHLATKLISNSKTIRQTDFIRIYKIKISTWTTKLTTYLRKENNARRSWLSIESPSQKRRGLVFNSTIMKKNILGNKRQKEEVWKDLEGMWSWGILNSIKHIIFRLSVKMLWLRIKVWNKKIIILNDDLFKY